MSNETYKPGRNGGSSQVTPPDGPATPGGTARQIDQLGDFFGRAEETCRRVARVVREGGFDSRTLDVMEEAAEHFEESDDIGAGTGLSLRRLIAQYRKGT